MVSMQVLAQTNPITSINITLPTNPDANTANWGAGTSLLLITASTPPTAGPINAVVSESTLLLIIKKGGSKVCGSYTSSSALSSGFNTPTKVWSGNNAVSYLGSGCTLPAGDYELSVQFFGYSNGKIAAISDEKIKPFTIKGNDQQAYQPPQAITPADGTAFTAATITQPITFRWVPVIPKPQAPVNYRLSVWQLMVGQTGVQAIKANQPILTKDVNNITQTVINNLVNGPASPRYLNSFVWTVQALDPQGKPIGSNNGTSTPVSFNVPNPNNNNLRSMSAGCTVSTKQYAVGDVISLSDDFKMTFTAAPTGPDSSLTGTGTVKVKWLGLINVKFKNIKVSNDDKLCTGSIYSNSDPSQVYPTQWAVNVLNNASAGPWTNNKIKAVSTAIQNNKIIKPLIAATSHIGSIPFVTPINMPVGYFKADDSTNAIGITEMIFKADHAVFTATASLNTTGIFKNAGNTFNGTDAIALEGDSINFTNSGLSSLSGTIKLAQPVTFTYANTNTENLKLTFNTDTSGHIGNSIVFSSDTTSGWTYNFDADVQLPKQWLTPIDTSKTNVSMNFQLAISAWDDYVLQGNLPACTIPNTNGLGIEAGMITYDHSTSANADSMAFPHGFTGDTSEMFTGFYLKKFKLTLPSQLRSYADTTKNIEIGAENLIINKDGLSGKIYANNVLNYPKANVGNLGASIDTVRVSLVSSTLTEASMLGKITLPLSTTDNTGNAINYSAMFIPSNTLSNNTSSITFSLQPAQNITTRFLGDGKLQIDQTSTLDLKITKSGSQKRHIAFDIDLNGKISYTGGKIMDVGSNIPLDLDLSCTFQHLGMSYKKMAKDTFSFNPGQWSFASPQKALSGFAFTITNVVPKIEAPNPTTEKQYLFKGGVEFDVKINIGSENSNIAISGDTKIALTGAIISDKYTPPANSNTSTQAASSTQALHLQTINTAINNTTNAVNTARTDYGFLAQLKPVYLGVQVESISIDTETPAVSIKGNVDFYKHDATYGNGFKGDITAKFKTLELAIQAGAIFGNTKYIPGHTTGFKYWMVQAQVNLPPPGIPFLPGVAFRGFGAGVYSRMNMTPPAVFNPTTAAASTFGGATFTPDQTVSIGFKVKAIVATTPKEETFNGSVALGAEFNSSGGMNFIDIDGLFNCGAKIGQESQAFANGSLIVRYDFPQKIFDMKATLNMNNDVVKTINPLHAHFYIDGLKNEWAFTCGVPDTLNTVRLLDAFNVSEYLMFGNKIPVPHGFMPATVAGLQAAKLSYPFGQSAVSSETKTAKGFAFGIGVNFAGSDSFDGLSVGCLIGKGSLTGGVRWNYSAGGEFDASLLQYDATVCPGLGHTGWRMKTQVALYANASVQAFYHRCTGQNGTVNLVSIYGGAYASAEFPNPFYASGAISAGVNILDGLISFGYSATFKTKGAPCGGAALAEPNSTVYAQQDEADSLSYTLIKSIITPGGTSEIARTTTFGALLNYPYNEGFDVQEQQSSGAVKIRTFRAFYTATLTKDSVNNTVIAGNASHAAQLVQPATTTSATPQSGIAAVRAATTQPMQAAATLNTTNIAGNRTAASATLAMNHAATLAISNNVDLVDGGYDALGAKVFKQNDLNHAMLDPTKVLKGNTSYKFEITAALQEFVNNTWQPVKNQHTNNPVTQTKNIYFKTNTEPVGVITQASNVQMMHN